MLWGSKTGLEVRLAPSDGRIEDVVLGGRSLPLSVGAFGGLSFRELVKRDRVEAQRLLEVGAEKATTAWSSAVGKDWACVTPYVQRVTGDAVAGGGFLRIGDGEQAGSGLAVDRRLALIPRHVCRVTWQARTPDPSMSYIVCLRLFDQEGMDVTATTSAPAADGGGVWRYSPYSNAHYRVDFHNRQADEWEQLFCEYTVPDGVSSAWLSLRVYTGGALQADIDSLVVDLRPPPGAWSPERRVGGEVRREGTRLLQTAELTDVGLRFDARYETSRDGLLANVRVTPLRTTLDSGRCLQIRYRLPVAIDGWEWAHNPSSCIVLREGVSASAGAPWSEYPLACVQDATGGLTIAVPMDQPAAQTFTADANGLSTQVDLGLATGPSTARTDFTFALYGPEPGWGFRSALEGYYVLFDHLSVNRTTRLGGWTLRLPKPLIADPEDFSLAYYECGVISTASREYCRKHNIKTFLYSEPWGRRQVFPDAKTRADMPPYEERLGQVRTWALGEGGNAKWRQAPRQVTAQAVLNSLFIGADGQGAYKVDLYSHWAQWWQLNPNPSLPPPNIAQVCRDYEIDPALEWADGIYLDSVSGAHMRYEDYSTAHSAAATCPLTFSRRAVAPVVLSAFSNYEFIAWLRQYLERRGKLLMLNLFPPATRFYGHLGDVVGCELRGNQADRHALNQRIYARQRPVSNLLQWKFSVLKRVPAMTHEQMASYIDNQLFYGFWPGISTAGGGTEPGYRYLHRYFNDPSLYERDRGLFTKADAMLRELHDAGWQPVTRAQATSDDIRIERFGPNKAGGVAYLTVCNTGPETREAGIDLEPEWWEAALGTKGRLRMTECYSGTDVQFVHREDRLGCRLSVPAERTLVLRITP